MSEPNLRVLGIDPGFGRMGWGVVEKSGGEPVFVAAGCIETEKKSTQGARLATIHHELLGLITTHRPTLMSIESLIFSTNVTTAIRVGEARGVALLAAEERHLPILEFSPSQVKSSTTGSGRASKADMIRMISLQLHLTSTPWPDDAIDALAIGLCGLFSYGILNRPRR